MLLWIYVELLQVIFFVAPSSEFKKRGSDSNIQFWIMTWRDYT